MLSSAAAVWRSPPADFSDLADDQAIAAAAEKAIAIVPRLDLLVNASGFCMATVLALKTAGTGQSGIVAADLYD
ncbi:hypothetical protein [Synechococcus elongatus]|uniref:hypothetical protein n=1 Tax=Synechococcus elongatus TaxID=32046 RepID=UPI0030CB5DF0